MSIELHLNCFINIHSFDVYQMNWNWTCEFRSTLEKKVHILMHRSDDPE